MGRYVDENAEVESIDDVGDVTSTSPTDGDILEYDGNSNEWVNNDTVNGGVF